jgi:hypothetical protein
MKKQLLNERQIRKMMKIANITPLANGFIDRLTENEMFEAALEEQDEDPLADLGGGDEAGGDDPMADLGADDEMGAEAGGEDDDPLCSAMTALKALKLGLEELDPEAAGKIQIETEDEEGDDEGGDMADLGGDDEGGDMADLGGDDEGGDLADLGGVGEEDDELAGLAEANIYLHEGRQHRVAVPNLQRRRPNRLGQRRIVSEVTQRVAKRLMNLKRQSKRRH